MERGRKERVRVRTKEKRAKVILYTLESINKMQKISNKNSFKNPMCLEIKWHASE